MGSKAIRGYRWVCVDLARPRVVDEDGVLVLCRPAPAGGGADGVGCLMTGCASPECNCTEVSLDGVMLDARTEAVGFEVRKGDVALRLAAGSEMTAAPAAFALTLELSTGDLSSKDGSPPPAGLDLAWLGREMDGDLLDRLYAALLAGKGLIGTDEPRPCDEITEWARGDKMHYDYLFPGSRPDRYRVGGRLYDIGDVLCPDSSCGCATAILDVEEIIEDGVPVPIGHAIVSVPASSGASKDPARPRRLEFVPRAGFDRSLLETLYMLYRGRYPDENRLRERQERVRAAMKPLFGPRSEVPRLLSRAAPVGRNDPCPCGSGKKFKKCCGAAGTAR